MIALLLLAGCPLEQEFSPSTKDKGNNELVPDIEIEPDSLTFAEAAPGVETTQEIKITNDGDADLHVTNLVLSGTTAFKVGTTETSASIAPGASIIVPITFTPVNPTDYATLIVTSDDADSGELEVPLAGSGTIPQIFVAPNPYTFGSVLLDCEREQPLKVTNVGNGTLIVDNSVTTAAGFTVTPPGLPVYLAHGESADFPLSFTPTAEEDYGGEVWFTSNSLVNTTVVAVSGHGTTDPNVEDEFWQGDGPWDRTDIFFYVDQSGSMGDDQQNMIDNFSGFVETLRLLDMDWQIMISTRDSGCNNTGILTPESANLETAVLEGISGAGGRYTEAGLAVTDAALQRTGAGDCNAGFLREDSKTSLVVVSDEPDQSPGSYATYVNDILTRAPNASITAIVGPIPDGCVNGSETADAGHGYYEAALATHGAFLSICEQDWTTYFDAIATLSSTGQTDRFGLSTPPDPTTIVVYVDNVPVTSGWTYDEAGQAVVFDADHLPEPGTHIVVDYSIPLDCAD